MAGAAERLRWTTIDEEAPLPGLGERITHPGFEGIEFVHVRAKSLLNHVPAAANMPFEWTINVYRGCTHACTYCAAPDTPVLMADGRTRRIEDLRVGDRIYGTVRDGAYRRYTVTEVRDHWRTVRRAYRVTLADGTTLITSGDHRLLTERGWKHVADTRVGQRPHLTTNNVLRGTGGFADTPKHDEAYRTGYLAGMIRGDGAIGSYRSTRRSGTSDDRSIFRLALADDEALDRTRSFLDLAGVPTDRFSFSPATATRRAIAAIRTQRRAAVERIRELIAWPLDPDDQWWLGFLAGVFDAEGSCSSGALRITNGDREMLDMVGAGLDRFGFDHVLEGPRPNGCWMVRLRGGLRERLRFFLSTDPAITRKRTMEGLALKSDADLRVTAIEDLGVELPMYDITTGTGDFIADGVVHHNCFARPSHTWLDLDAGRDFESVIVVKINAVERLRAELRSSRWQGDHVALGTNTDPYQRAEGRYRLTRGVVETLTDAGNSYSVLTKGTLVTRDLDVLGDAAARGVCTGVALSIPTLDDEVWRGTEPGTPHPARRMETVAALNDAGIPAGVMVAPIIPGLSDGREQLDRVVRAAIDAGASHITPITLHLRPGVREVFLPWLEREHPELADRYQRLYRRSYAPEAERRRISRLVHDLVDAKGGVRAPRPPRGRERSAATRRATAGTAATSAQQAAGSTEPSQLPLW
jgi:DNA repair photolyase